MSARLATSIATSYSLLRLPVGRGGLINSPCFCIFFALQIGLPLMGDTVGIVVWAQFNRVNRSFLLLFQTAVGPVGQDGVVVLLDNVLEIRRSGRERVRIPHQIVAERIVLEITLKMQIVQVFHFLSYFRFVIACEIFARHFTNRRFTEYPFNSKTRYNIVFVCRSC